MGLLSAEWASAYSVPHRRKHHATGHSNSDDDASVSTDGTLKVETAALHPFTVVSIKMSTRVVSQFELGVEALCENHSITSLALRSGGNTG
jgi:hypothetical protein